MTSNRDIERVLDHWFADHPADVADRVLDDVADRIARQRQRPAWRVPWRDAAMNSIVKVGAAVAAVVLIAVIGYNLLPASQPQVGGPGPSTTPSSTPAPPSESPSPSLAYVWPGSLTPGTYTSRLIWDIPFELQFTVPGGWESRDVEVIRDELSVAFHLAGNTFSDPCGRVEMNPPTGPTVDDLATALAAMPEFDATAPVPVSAAGLDVGRYLELTVRDDAACEVPGMWNDPPDSYNGQGPMGPPSWAAELPNQRMWILDVDGVRLVVSALWSDSATPPDLTELQTVVDSVRIVPPTGPPVALPSPS